MITQTKDSQQQITPEIALGMLQEGNQRFVQKNQKERDLMVQVDQTSTGQFPFATVLGCIDSRVSPELVFDQGVGDIFGIRIAGNIANEDILGSMEFATQVAGTKLVVVLGHTKCGAVTGACNGVELGNLTGLLDKIKPAIDAETEVTENRDGSNPDFVQSVSVKNVHLTVEGIRRRSEVLRSLETDGKIRIVGGMYDVKTGKVDFYTD